MSHITQNKHYKDNDLFANETDLHVNDIMENYFIVNEEMCDMNTEQIWTVCIKQQ